MSLNLIKKYYKELIAISILWIAMRHSYFQSTFKPMDFVVSRCGYGGVDMLLFLLCFYFYYDYQTNSNYFSFIKRKLFYVFSYSIPFFLLLLIKKISFNDLILFLSGLSLFVRTDLSFWVSSIIIWLVLLSPIYIKIMDRKPTFVTIVSITIVTIVCLLFEDYRYFYIYFRLTSCFTGFYLAYISKQNKYDKRIYIYLILISIIGWIMMYCMYHFYRNDVMHVFPFLLIIPREVAFLSIILSRIKFLNSTLTHFSVIMYPFFLMHESIINYLYFHYGDLFISGIGFDWWINIGRIVIAILISIVFKYISDALYRLCAKRLEIY